ncbi:MAG: tetratricopeptide repeat protein [Bacteroidota bacterium]
MRTYLTCLLIPAAALFSSCSSPSAAELEAERKQHEKDSLHKLVKHLDSLVYYNRKGDKVDLKVSNSAVKSHLAYAERYPGEKDAALYLFRASDVAINDLNQPALSVKILEDLVRRYPDFKELPICYFQLGTTYDNRLQDTAKTRMYYDLFLEKYPNHELAPQVRTLKTLVGKNIDDIIRDGKGK